MKNNKKIILSTCLSNFFEFYEFSLFTVFVTVLSGVFFPKDAEITSILKTLLVFSMAFFARPLGSLFFGYVGDKHGRKRSLILSILLMSFSTALIGILPCYESIGYFSTAFLILARFMQGFSLGGESTGSFIFLMEHSPSRKGLMTSLVLTLGTVSYVFTNGIASYLSTPGLFPEWIWRVPFIFSLFLGGIAFYIRSSIEESEEYEENKKEEINKKIYTPHFFSVIGAAFANSALVYTTTVYMNVYLQKFKGLPMSQSLTYTNYALMFCIFMLPIMGLLSDKYTPRKVMRVGFVLCFFASGIVPFLMEYDNYLLTLLIMGFIIACVNGPTPYYISSLFPPKIRYTYVSVGFSIGASFGSLYPFIYTYVTDCFNNIYAISPFFLLISVVGFLTKSEFQNVDIRKVPAV